MNKIFILEDDPERIGWFKKTFSDCDVFIIAELNEAFNKLKSEKFDMIFLDRDISNPYVNGEDLAWKMKENKIAKSSPIVIHSENARGQRIIARYLRTYNNNVMVIPFHKLKSNSKEDIFKMNKISKAKIEKKEDNDSVMNTFLQMREQTYESKQKTTAAHALFKLWVNKRNKISQTRYRKPSNLSSNEIDCMCKEGLVRTIGNNFEITGIGSEIIKIMILGDNRCALEKDYDIPIDIRVAKANTQKKKNKKKNKYEQNWWNRFV